MKHALLIGALLIASPAFAQGPSGDAEALSQAPVFQSIPAHQAVVDTAAVGSDAEILATTATNGSPAHRAVGQSARIPSGDSGLRLSTLAVRTLGVGNSSIQ